MSDGARESGHIVGQRQVEKELPPTTQNLLRTEIHSLKKKLYPGSRNRMWRIVPTVNFTGPRIASGTNLGYAYEEFSGLG